MSDSYLPKNYLLQCKLFENDEKCFLMHFCFRSQGIYVFVLIFAHLEKTTWLER